MYELSVPVMVTSKAFDKEKILADLRLARAKRVFLAIGALTTNEEKQFSNEEIKKATEKNTEFSPV